jgi:hypothetical protein
MSSIITTLSQTFQASLCQESTILDHDPDKGRLSGTGKESKFNNGTRIPYSRLKAVSSTDQHALEVECLITPRHDWVRSLILMSTCRLTRKLNKDCCKIIATKAQSRLLARRCTPSRYVRTKLTLAGLNDSYLTPGSFAKISL